MPKVKDYRVKLNLSNIFQDHRQYCYTFIRSNYDTVADLMQHIKRTYEIQDFFLTVTKKKCFYLSPHEDIRIIQPNNTIIVIPNDLKASRNTTLINNATEVLQSSVSPKLNAKKKRKITEGSVNDNVNEIILFEDIVPKKKTKKGNRKTQENYIAQKPECSTSSSVHAGEQINVKVKKVTNAFEKKIKKNKLAENGVEYNMQSECATNNVESEFSNSKENVDTPMTEIKTNSIQDSNSKLNNSSLSNISNIVAIKQDSFISSNSPGKLIAHFTPTRNILPASTIEKKFNVIKNIIINSTMEDKGMLAPNSQSLNSNKITEITHDMNIAPNLNTSETKESPKQNISLTSNSPESVTSSIDGKFVTKRKRTRVRKKKLVNKVHQDSPMPVRMLPGKKIESGKPLVHKYFDDIVEISDSSMQNRDEQQFAINKEITFHNTTNASLVSNAESSNSHIALDAAENSQIMNTSPSTQNVDSLTFFGKTITPELISKFQLMTHIIPRTNDFIIFQKLKLGADFTPDISKHIIGQVVQYNESSQEVQIRVTLGIEEFEEPQGSLSMCDYDENIKWVPNVLQTLCWTNLIQPRLLTP